MTAMSSSMWEVLDVMKKHGGSLVLKNACWTYAGCPTRHEAIAERQKRSGAELMSRHNINTRPVWVAGLHTLKSLSRRELIEFDESAGTCRLVNNWNAILENILG